MPEQSQNRPNLIWNSIKETNIKVDEVISLFQIKKKEEPKSEVNKSKIETKKFLDSKRTQEVSIILTKLPDPEIIDKALIVFDESSLNGDQIEGLLKILITSEELKMYQEMGPEGNWDKGEKYLIKINEIPNHQIKLKIWSLIIKFEEKIPGLIESLEFMKNGCDEIRNDKYFKLILSLILALGNILNAGTNKGQADGFAFDFLNKISGIKDNLGNSILTWVCSKAKSKDPSFVGFKDRFPQLEKASRISLKETNDNLNGQKKILSQLESLLKELGEDDKFKQKALEKFDKFKVNIEDLEKKNNENTKYYQNFAKYCGYKEKDDILEKNEVLFTMLLNFFKEIDKAMPKQDVKSLMSKKKAAGKKVDQNKIIDNIISDLKRTDKK